MKLYVVAAIAGLSLMLQGAAQAPGDHGPAARGPAAHGPAREPRRDPPPNVITPTYNSVGTVESITPGFIRIDHQEITELDWPAMTMTYEVRSPPMVTNITLGTPVRFSFRREGFSWVLMQIAKQ